MDIMSKYEPIYSHMSKYGEEISNEKLGKRVRYSFERHQQYIEEHMAEWEEKGKEFRRERESRNISRDCISELIGVSPQTLSKLEKGKSVRSRRMLEQSFKTAIEYIDLQKRLDSLK